MSLTKKVKGELHNLDYNKLLEADKNYSSFFIRRRPSLYPKLGIAQKNILCADILEMILFYLPYFVGMNGKDEIFESVQKGFDFQNNNGEISFTLKHSFFEDKLLIERRNFYKVVASMLELKLIVELESKKQRRFSLSKNVWEVIVEGKNNMARRPDRNKTAGMEKAGVEVEVEKKVLVKTPTQKAIDFLLKIKNKIKQSEPDVLFNAHKDIGSKSVVRKFIEDLSPTDEELELCAEYYVNGWFGGASVKTRLVGVYFKVDSGGAGNTMENAKAWDKAGRPKERPSKFKNTNQNIGKGKQLSDEEKAEMEAALFGGK